MPIVPDLFSTGETLNGCGHTLRTVYKGDRVTAANYLLNQGSNLAIKTDSTVDKISFENESQNLRARAVRVIESNGSAREFKARKEIIVSAGAYCSPAILMRSGIGPKKSLSSHDIECKVELPGVGQNLMDHVVSCSYK